MLRIVYCILNCLVFILPLKAQIVVKCDKSPTELVNLLIGTNANGILIKDVNFEGSKFSIGEYHTFSKLMPINKGIVLSTGNVSDIDGPNESPNIGTATFMLGDEQLQHYVGKSTFDATILEFTFYANTNEISFDYSFASEEYPEYVNKGVNDVFAFFISGYGYTEATNIALLPNSNNVVSVDNVNAQTNSSFFIENLKWDISNPVFIEKPQVGELSYNCEFDGMTVALTAKAKTTPYKPYKIRIAIADVGDNVYDSGVFLKKESFKSSGISEPFQALLINDLTDLADSLDVVGTKIINDTVHVISSIQFAFNSHLIDTSYLKYLDSLAQLFIRYFDKNILIEGHSDDVGDNAYNMQLSTGRANEVYNYLVLHGVPKNRLQFIGKGNSCPFTSSTDNDARRQNRRVEFLVY